MDADGRSLRGGAFGAEPAGADADGRSLRSEPWGGACIASLPLSLCAIPLIV